MASPRISHDTLSSVSTTSLVFERIGEREKTKASGHYGEHDDRLDQGRDFDDDDGDDERGAFLRGAVRKSKNLAMDRGFKRCLLILAGVLVAVWGAGLFMFVSSKSYKHVSQEEHNPTATAVRGSGKKISLEQIQSGFWSPESHEIGWISGANGEDGLLLETDAVGKDYLVIEDVWSKSTETDLVNGQFMQAQSLMREPAFEYDGVRMMPKKVWPSPDLKKVLIVTDSKRNWRHSFTGIYWILDVATQKVETLHPDDAELRVQLAQWSPKSNAISFTSGNNLYIRRLDPESGKKSVVQVTTDGGPEYFYGIPDWVYEEEVFSGNSATWWSENGDYLAFLRTNETQVPAYPIQYFLSRPSGTEPPEGEEAYPEVRQIKYPKAGSPNPVVDLLFFDLSSDEMFSVDIPGGFVPEDLLITDVTWADNKVVIKETNRVSDILRVVLVDVMSRTGKTVRTVDVTKIDGGWFEITTNKYIPADPANGRPDDGYIEKGIHDNGNHLAYFTPLDNPNPIMLTSGDWEVDTLEAVDLKNNLVYFKATKESSITRHIYTVQLDGSNLQPVTDISKEGYYDVSFSKMSGYALLSYEGPGIPWQRIISTPGNNATFNFSIESNAFLAEKARKHELPLLNYGTINVDGFDLNFVERRPPHFDPSKKYPVLFQQYSGPGSQSVSKRFQVDFQSYVAASLNYIVVTVDGRGTGFIGRKARVCVRKQLGMWESHDQIAAAKIWANKPYVDADHLAIWGWSYGGFMTLKTLEQDAGQTFKYGMAVAPVTNWRFYDSIYTERYMLTPQLNQDGYASTAVQNATALGQNVRFMILHGVADDNVHMQNTLTLLDAFNEASVTNFDMQMFPDSDHAIQFHDANPIVFEKLENWLVNAFNGEWLKVNNPTPAAPKHERSLSAG